MHRAHAEPLARLAVEEWYRKDPPDISTLVPEYGLEFGKPDV